MPAISVIIPYYNDPINFFSDCLTSIVSQSFIDIEVIVVNDGSAKDNAVLLERECNIDKRIRLIKQDNLGVSAARNRGVQEASGEYIAFVDADDVVLPEFLSAVYRIALSKSADVVYSYVFHGTEGATSHNRKTANLVTSADDEWLKKYTVGSLCKKGDGIIFGRGPWARLIKSDLAKSIPFPVGVPVGEDVLWNLEIIKQASKKIIVDYAWYEYLIRSSSVTQKYDKSINEKLQPFYKKIGNYVNEGFLKPEYYYNRVLRDLKRYIFRSCFGNQNNTDSFFKKWHGFNQTLSVYPWIELSTRDVWDITNIKGKIKLFAVRTRIIFPIWYIGLLKNSE